MAYCVTKGACMGSDGGCDPRKEIIMKNNNKMKKSHGGKSKFTILLHFFFLGDSLEMKVTRHPPRGTETLASSRV